MEVPFSVALALVVVGVGIGITVARVWAFFTMRNCDRFDNFDEARVSFLRESSEGSPHEFGVWLFERVFESHKNKEAK